MANLTPQQRAAYLKDSEVCPLCDEWVRSGNLNYVRLPSGEVRVEGLGICTLCRTRFKEIFTLADVKMLSNA